MSKLETLIKQLNADFSTSLVPADFSGYLMKKLTNSTSISTVSTSGKQYHIDVTNTTGPMQLFPIVVASENLEGVTYSSDRKRDFQAKVPLVIYEKNISDLLVDIGTRASSNSLALKLPVSTLNADKLAVFGSNSSVESHTHLSYARRSTGQHQIEVGISSDDSAFLLLRASLLPNDYILFLKRKNEFRYFVFGLKEATFVANYEPILGSDLFELEKDTTAITTTLITLASKVSSKSRNLIFFGPPGTGKSTLANSYIDGKESFRTTFHPDTDYSAFVGSYKPTVDTTGLIRYQFVPQVFINAYLQAWEKPTEEIFLVIEEINRGNCAQIFGDIFQLLDRDTDGYSRYPIMIDTDIRQYVESYFNDVTRSTARTYYDDTFAEKFGARGFSKIALPPNLILVATMNTSDQSLFPMDSAFKRRWDWEYVRIDYEPANNIEILIDSTNKYSWGSFLQIINALILENTHSEDKQIGNWFIIPEGGVIDYERFRSKVMFYLWNEVCKEEYQTDRNLFKFLSTTGDSCDFTFNDLYIGYDKSGESVGPIQLITRFMDFHHIQRA